MQTKGINNQINKQLDKRLKMKDTTVTENEYNMYQSSVMSINSNQQYMRVTIYSTEQQQKAVI